MTFYRALFLIFFNACYLVQINTYANSFFHAELQMNDRLSIPFTIEYQSGVFPQLSIINGLETIKMKFLAKKGDSLIFEFPQIAGKIVFSKINHRGYWLNQNKVVQTMIPFLFYESKQASLRLDQNLDTSGQSYTGTYSIGFNDGQTIEPAIGIFYKNERSIFYGTFRTESGDYRYLEGGVVNNVLKLSCFDGVHAYLFEIKLMDSTTIEGDFYSGLKYHAIINGKRDAAAHLKSPYELCVPKSDNTVLKISVNNLKGLPVELNHDYFIGKVTVVQILGSWCPNCLDETFYFQSLIKNPEYKHLRIIGIAFENGIDDEDRIKRIKKFIKKTKINYPVYLGGGTKNQTATTVFNQLNGVYCFPTTLFLNKKGEIVLVHAGFDGPGTGVFYEEYKKKTETLIKQLMQN